MPAAFIQGASGGQGLAITKKLLAATKFNVIAACRNPDKLREKLSAELGGSNNKLDFLRVDVTDEASIKDAATYVKQKYGKNSLKLVLNCSGILLDPEKSFRQLESDKMEHVFKVNCHGPSLVYKHFFDLLENKKASINSKESNEAGSPQLPDFSIMASISAKIGSLGDNNQGGWMSYRSSKASLNMMTKCLAFELYNRNLNSIAFCYHPGTVATNLSKSYLANIPKEKIFSPQYAADCLYKNLCSLSLEDNGKIISWDGKHLPY